MREEKRGTLTKASWKGSTDARTKVERGEMHGRKEEEKPSEIRTVTRPMMIRMTMPSSTSEEAA